MATHPQARKHSLSHLQNPEASSVCRLKTQSIRLGVQLLLLQHGAPKGSLLISPWGKCKETPSQERLKATDGDAEQGWSLEHCRVAVAGLGKLRHRGTAAEPSAKRMGTQQIGGIPHSASPWLPVPLVLLCQRTWGDGSCGTQV